MARRGRREERAARELGSESPASGSAKQQDIAGARGGPREGGRRASKQPPQESGRRPRKHEQAPQERKSFQGDSAHDPAQQGRGQPKPDTLTESQPSQGIGARSGDSAEGGARVEEQAKRGGPRSRHVRHGRQHISSDRGG